MSQKIYLNTNAIVKLQQMLSDEIAATENVIDQYETACYPIESLEFDLRILKDIEYAVNHATNKIGK